MKARPVFFCLMHGLRGGYMPDGVEHGAARTLEEFSAAVRDYVRFHDFAWNLDYPEGAEINAANYPDADSTDARVVALLEAGWKHAQGGRLELCLAIGATWDSADDNRACEIQDSYGLTVSTGSRGDLLAYRRECRAA